MFSIHTLLVALQHTDITRRQASIMAELPSPFCVCKRCYAHCEELDQTLLVCPKLSEQSYIAERVYGMMQFPAAHKHLLRSHEAHDLKAIVFALAYMELCSELYRTLLIMKLPLLATDPNQLNNNFALLDHEKRQPTLEQAEAKVHDHLRRKYNAEIREINRRSRH